MAKHVKVIGEIEQLGLETNLSKTILCHCNCKPSKVWLQNFLFFIKNYF